MLFGRFGPIELILILAIALLIFGPKKVPEIGKAIGKAIREFRNGSKQADEDEGEDNREEITEEERKQISQETTSNTKKKTRGNKKEKSSS